MRITTIRTFKQIFTGVKYVHPFVKMETLNIHNYSNFYVLSLSCFISHVSSVTESGFFINKHHIHGYSLQNDAIISMRLFKDEFCLVGGVTKLQLNRDLIFSLKSARAKYFPTIKETESKNKQGKESVES